MVDLLVAAPARIRLRHYDVSVTQDREADRGRSRAGHGSGWPRALLALGVVLAVVVFEATVHRLVAVDGVAPASALVVAFVNHGQAPAEVGVFHEGPGPADGGRVFYWDDGETLRRGLVEALEEAALLGLDGERRIDGRLAALDLVFASNHSLRVIESGGEGELVGEIRVDRSMPSPERGTLLEVLRELALSRAGGFEGVRIHTVTLLWCGSDEDDLDHHLVRESVEALTGVPCERLLVTDGKVVPDMRYVAPGHARSEPLTLHEVVFADERTRLEPFVRIDAGGWLDLVSGRGAEINSRERIR
jgi:hypothetical protein